MKPSLSITVNGQEMADEFFARLVSATFVDQEGRESDTCNLELNDGPEAGFLAIPDKGALIEAKINDEFVGKYTLDTLTVKALPYSLQLSGKAADIRSEMKRSKERHWDDKTVGDIVKEIAGEHGLDPRVSDAVGAVMLPWWGQHGESDMQLLELLARRHNAVFAVKNGRLIFAERGSGASGSGQSISARTIRPGDLMPGTFSVTITDRTRYKEVVANVTDLAKNKRVVVVEISDDEGEGEFELRETFATEDEAKAAAKSKAKELKRAGERLSFSTLLDPTLFAGMPFTTADIRPGIDGQQWIAKTVRHQISKSGAKTTVDAEVKV